MKCPNCGYEFEEKKEYIEIIKKIVSLGAQGKIKEAEKLCKKELEAIKTF